MVVPSQRRGREDEAEQRRKCSGPWVLKVKDSESEQSFRVPPAWVTLLIHSAACLGVIHLKFPSLPDSGAAQESWQEIKGLGVKGVPLSQALHRVSNSDTLYMCYRQTDGAFRVLVWFGFLFADTFWLLIYLFVCLL